MMGAVAILKEGGEAYQTYLEGFKEAHPQYAIQRVSGSEKALEDQYATQSNTFKDKHTSLEAQYQQKKLSIDQKGKELGLPENIEDSTIKNDVQQKQIEAESRIEARQERMQDTSLQKKVDTAREENVVLGNAKQLGSSIQYSVSGIQKEESE